MLYIYGEIRCFSYKYIYNKVELQIFLKIHDAQRRRFHTQG